jgi:hypothetical protein
MRQVGEHFARLLSVGRNSVSKSGNPRSFRLGCYAIHLAGVHWFEEAGASTMSVRLSIEPQVLALLLEESAETDAGISLWMETGTDEWQSLKFAIEPDTPTADVLAACEAGFWMACASKLGLDAFDGNMGEGGIELLHVHIGRTEPSWLSEFLKATHADRPQESASESQVSRLISARDPKTSTEELTELVAGGSDQERWLVWRNPAASDETRAMATLSIEGAIADLSVRAGRSRAFYSWNQYARRVWHAVLTQEELAELVEGLGDESLELLSESEDGIANQGGEIDSDDSSYRDTCLEIFDGMEPEDVSYENQHGFEVGYAQ